MHGTESFGASGPPGPHRGRRSHAAQDHPGAIDQVVISPGGLDSAPLTPRGMHRSVVSVHATLDAAHRSLVEAAGWRDTARDSLTLSETVSATILA